MNPWLHPSRSRKNGNVLDPETENVGPDREITITEGKGLDPGIKIIVEGVQDLGIEREDRGQEIEIVQVVAGMKMTTKQN